MNKVAPKKCPNCGTDNSFDATYCSNCSSVFDPKVAMEITAEATRKEKEIWELKNTIAELKTSMERMSKDIAENQAAKDEFKAVIEEERVQVRAV